MFRITEDPSSESLVQCLAKNYKNDSIVSVDMDKVGVMAAYSDPLCVCACVCSSLYMRVLPSYTVNYTLHCHNTDLVRVNGHDRIIRFVIPVVFIIKLDWSVCTV